jgi:hypothetical protein
MEQTNIPATVLDLLSPYLIEGGDSLKEGSPAEDYADLEISLHRRGGEAYTVETRFIPPGSSAEMRLGSDLPVEIVIDKEALSQHAIDSDWDGYGRTLSQGLFMSESLKMLFGQALARAGNGALRLRLLFGPTAQELHRLYWETLLNPLDGSLLTTNQQILFSRYLASADEDEVYLPPRSAIRALAAVASPGDLSEYGLAAVDVDGEIQRVKSSLKGTQITILPAGAERCTLPGLVRCLQDGCEIFYLVAHGAVVRDQAWLWLEDEDGLTRRVSGDELAAQIDALERPPLLVVLASCESAGKGAGDAMQALGPQICEAGVPAVIAMQGKISIESLEQGMPVLFERLQEDCTVDRALASARAALAAGGAADLWMPVLYMRLKDGSICEPLGEAAPPLMRKAWSLIQLRFQGKPAAEGALDDLLWDASDADNLSAFSIQLKKALRDDQVFANELSAIIEAYLKVSGKNQPGISINVGGNVGGNIVIGSNNTVTS